MKPRIAALSLCVAITGWGLGGPSVGLEVLSERGTALDAESMVPERRTVEIVPGGMERSFQEQPPMIPHPIEKYEISLRLNGCLKCHSDGTYQREHAKRTPDSHYLDRDGKKQERISSRRYFCTQCHAVQLTGEPLVENTFEGR